ncbi:hypothetical protein LIER_43218 [Lithospermum erythrorhizon]|uniref:Reverse transcriptase domain-containing protein n=1 Tax=Lithospermum erythrorhizon TaxID=34254 RepID=A0AAV3PPP8_LITER
MSDFRPISLCNIIAKIIGRIMTNRLKGVLVNIISETQSAFLPGCFISDNILVSHELLHYMKHKVTSKNAFMSLKLDMSKAYDRIEWKFLESIMLKLGFSRILVDWTMCLVSSVSYSFLVNGAPRGFIRPTRGIRQGHLLLPYLFLLCAEGLTYMTRKAEERKALTGVKISKESPSISHIRFADDTMLFCKASARESQMVIRILRDYETASGQKINLEKCSVSFDSSASRSTRMEMLEVLGMREVEDQGKYLGLPSQIGRSKRQVYSYIVGKVEDRLRGWIWKMLSQAGKEIMIKSVTSTIPIFVMNYFKLLVGLIDNLNSSMTKFFWENAEGERGIHWKA